MQVPNKAPDHEEEPEFRVTDRRRVSPEGSREPAQAPEPQADRTTEPPPEAETPPPELLSTPDLVRIFIAELQARALVHLGLIPNPQTRLVTKDLPEARLAIDCVAALIEQLSSSGAPSERDQLRQMLADLQLGFAQQSGT